MKCPKCNYLGFETGDRCRNCGYDFSLIADADPAPIEIDLDLQNLGPEAQEPSAWAAEMDGALAAERPVAPQPELSLPTAVIEPESHPARVPPAATPVQAESPLPLFTGSYDVDSDEPLIKLPAAPRPPLAVRRTPATPRLRSTPLATARPPREPVLEFDEHRERTQGSDPKAGVIPRPMSGIWASSDRSRTPAAVSGEVSRPGVRLAAAALDYLLLCAIDVAVIYLTLRIAGLSMREWTALPPVPLAVFLLFVQWSYFCAFTALGGQTIGKMAFRLRVVAADNTRLDAALAARRAVVGSLSAAMFGLGFLPAFFDPERRAFHDRVARSRVIALPSA